MKLSADLISFQTRLGYTFGDPSLLIEAVTHSSMSSQTRHDNQRLEFLIWHHLNTLPMRQAQKHPCYEYFFLASAIKSSIF